MPLVHPMTMPSTRVGANAILRLQRFDGLSAAISGATATIDLAAPRWVLEMTTGALTPAEEAPWLAFLAGQRGGARRFFGFDPRRAAPLRYPNGQGAPGSWNGLCRLGAATPSNPSERLTLANAQPGYVVSAGDGIRITYGGAQVFHRSLETATVGAGGTVSVDVEPPVALVAPANDAAVVVSLLSPVLLMQLAPGSHEATPDGSCVRHSFTAFSVPS